MTPYERGLQGSAWQEPIQQEEDAAKINARLAWLSSERTQEVFKDIMKQSDSLVTDAIGLAKVNHQSDNSKQIVSKLIEADTLRKVVIKYGSR